MAALDRPAPGITSLRAPSARLVLWQASVGEHRDDPPLVGLRDREAAPERCIVAAEREQAVVTATVSHLKRLAKFLAPRHRRVPQVG